MAKTTITKKASKKYPEAKRRPRTELEAELGRALRDRIMPIIEAGKGDLEVNRPKRKVPHYPFVPSDHHPDPF